MKDYKGFCQGALRLVPVVLAWALASSPAFAVDTDGDGVDDLLDCAPTDAGIATVHRYYFDLDADGSGDAANPADLCSTTPFPGSVLWSGDPDDTDPLVVQVPVPKGTRRIGVDLTDSQLASHDVAGHVDELGLDAVALRLSWVLLESSPGNFDGPQMALLDYARDVALVSGAGIDLTISIVSGDGFVIPADLAAGFYGGTISLSDPAVSARYAALLDAVHARLDGVPLVSFQAGHEVDVIMQLVPDISLWIDFASLYGAAAAHARNLWGAGLPIGLTARAEGLTDPTTGPILAAMNGYSDRVSMTLAPHDDAFGVVDPAGIGTLLDDVAAAYPGTPLAVQSFDVASAPLTGSSGTRQAQAFAALIHWWDEHAVLEYVGLERLAPRSAQQLTAALASGRFTTTPGTEDVMSAWLATSGLLGTDGKPGAAYETLRSQLFARGWDSYPSSNTRSYRVAITSFAHEQIADAPLDPLVLDETFGVIASDADMVVHHFDRGVPWTEALTDDFSSATPPYSAGLLDTWDKLRSRQPAGHAVTVAVNALGVPRNLLAAYWGVGEGMVVDDAFQPQSTGVLADYTDRVLPPPFDTLAVDSPAVKTAYVNYLKRVIDYFEPDYLVTGLEVNLLAESGNTAALDAWIGLQQHVYTTLKADPAYADVPLVVSFAAEFLIEDEFGAPILIDVIQDPALAAAHWQAFTAIEPLVDVIGLSLYPIKTKYGATEIPAWLFDHLFEAIGERTAKPLAITETGFPALPVTVNGVPIAGDATRQARYFDLLFAEAAAHGNVRFVNQFAVRDLTTYMDHLRARANAEPPLENAALIEFFKFFEFIGLYTVDGTPRAVVDTFLDALARDYTGSQGAQTEVQLTSPAGDIAVDVGIDAEGMASYSVTLTGVPVLAASPLGIVVDGIDLGTGATAISHTLPLLVDEPFATRGSRSVAENRYMLSTVTLERAGAAGDAAIDIEFRVFDDGVAWRYIVPGSGERTVSGERTGWQFPAASTVWFQTNTTNYESFYFEGTVGVIGDNIGFPLTVQVPGGAYATVSEAATGGYSGLTLRGNLGDATLHAQFLEDGSWPVAGGTGSPWRFTVISPDLDGLVNSGMAERFSPDPDPVLFPDGLATAWIKPGKALWSWWSDELSGYSWETQRGFVEAAAFMGLDYVVVDAWWELGFAEGGSDPFNRLAELVDYAHADGRDVDIWVWKNWFELLDAGERDAFFSAVAASGAVGVKIDNVLGQGSDSRVSRIVREAVLYDAAVHGMLVNFHGMGKPTGLSRTWPNQVAQEGFAGLEVNGLAWDEGRFVPPAHNATLPFTRFVLGPGDYTPVTFDALKIGATTFAHQLATAGLFTSPVMHFADHPAVLMQQQSVQDLLVALPTEWDETRVLPPSAIGDAVVMARRAGDEWWLFAINGDEAAGRSFDVALDFLDDRSWTGNLVEDDTATAMLRSDAGGYDATAVMPVSLLPGGGFVARFRLERSFRMGVTSLPPAPDTGWPELFQFMQTGTDMIVHSFQEGVPWVQALGSSNLASYSTALQEQVSWLKLLDQSYLPDHAVYLMVNPMRVTYDGKALLWGETPDSPLPAPWDTLPFDHPDMVTAFANYLTMLVVELQPQYVAINVEANIFLAKAPLQWGAFKTFNAAVYLEMKQRFPNVKFFSTIQYEHMLGLHTESKALADALVDVYPDVLEAEVRALLGHSDVVGISTYPYMAIDHPDIVGGETVMRPGYYDPAFALADELFLPFAFEQVGWATIPFEAQPGQFVIASEAIQANFMARLLELSTRENALFISNFVAIDYGDQYGTGAVAQTWASAGLLRQDLAAKPALTPWQQFMQRVYTGATIEP